jgi:hypothetical protein
MAYSDYAHFSNKLSYKILFVLSYRLKDMNFVRFDHFLQKINKGKGYAERNGLKPGRT